MAFGSQNGRTGGGFGSGGENIFGSGSDNKGGIDFFGNNNNSFGGSSNGANGQSGTGFGQSSGSDQPSGFGQKADFGTQAAKDRNNNPINNSSAQSGAKTSNSHTSLKKIPIRQKNVFSTSCIRGIVSSYTIYSSKSDNYRRLLPAKIYQAFAYDQRFEDLLHSFTLTETIGHDSAGLPIMQSHVVNVHGSTGYGANLTAHIEVEVTGKFTRDNILMAKEVKVINGNVATPVNFQHSVKLIALTCLAILLFALAIFGFVSIGNSSSLAGVMNTVWSFVTTMFAVYVILLILYVVSLFTRIGFMTRLLSGGRRRSSPLLTMLVIAFILTLLLYNVFGLGSIVVATLAGALDAVGPLIVTIIAIVILIKVFK